MAPSHLFYEPVNLPESMLGVGLPRSQFAGTAFKPHKRGSTVSGFLQTVLSKAPNQPGRVCGHPVGASDKNLPFFVPNVRIADLHELISYSGTTYPNLS